MAGAMRKMAVYLGLVEEDDDRYDEYDDYGGYEMADTGSGRRIAGHESQREPVGAGAALRDGRDARDARGGRSVRDRAGVVATATAPAWEAHEPDHLVERPEASIEQRREPYRITTLHPRTYNDARMIGEQFRAGTPVIMNLTEMDDSDAKRLVDFAAGLIFGLHGSIERVTNKVFLLSPRDVDVTAEDKQRFAEAGFFNQS